jgi:hypothetical protein
VIVGEDPDTGRRVSHRTELSQLVAAQADSNRADWEHVTATSLHTEPPDLLHHSGGVGYRFGIGHRVQRRESAKSGGGGAASNGLGVLPPRFPQMCVQVYQAGQRDQAVCINDVPAPPRKTAADAEIGDNPIFD